LLVIDDGSQDNSVNVIQTLQNKYDFEFISQKNIGLLKTLNKALSLIETDYLCLLASDDTLHSNYIEKQMLILQENNDISLLTGKTLIIGKEIESNTNEEDALIDCSFDSLFSRKIKLPGPGMIFKRRDLLSIDGFDESLKIEDFYIQLKLADSGFRVVQNRNAYINYRVHDSNTTSRHLFMIQETKKIVDKFSHTKNFKKMKRIWYLKFFAKLCRYEPKEAIAFLPNVSKYFYFPKFWQGLLRLSLSPFKSLKK
jgi:alpha-1,3-rhamnosyltransferase